VLRLRESRRSAFRLWPRPAKPGRLILAARPVSETGKRSAHAEQASQKVLTIP